MTSMNREIDLEDQVLKKQSKDNYFFVELQNKGMCLIFKKSLRFFFKNTLKQKILKRISKIQLLIFYETIIDTYLFFK